MRKKGTGAYLRKYEEFHPKNSGQISRRAICVNSTSVRKAMILKAKYKILTCHSEKESLQLVIAS